MLLIKNTLTGAGLAITIVILAAITFGDITTEPPQENLPLADAAAAVTFEGVTSATFEGPQVNGIFGGNAKCQSEFPGSRMCSFEDLLNSGNTTSTSTGWVFSDSGAESSCSHYTNKSYNILDSYFLRANEVSYTGSIDTDFGITMDFRPDGTAIFLYWNNSDVWVASCSNVDCTSTTNTQVRSTADDGASLVVGTDGFADIAIDDGANLEFIDCQNHDCSSFVNRVLSTQNAIWTSIQTENVTGFPLIAYEVGGTLRMHTCTNAACTAGTDQVIWAGASIDWPEMRIRPNGNPIIQVQDGTDADLGFIYCDNSNCSNSRQLSQPSSVFEQDANGRQAMILNNDGNVVTMIRDDNSEGGILIQCGDENCTHAIRSQIWLNGSNDYALALAADGLPVIFGKPLNSVLSAYKCLDKYCTETDSFELDTGTSDGTGIAAKTRSDGNIQIFSQKGTSDNLRRYTMYPWSSHTGPIVTENGIGFAFCSEQHGIACCS